MYPIELFIWSCKTQFTSLYDHNGYFSRRLTFQIIHKYYVSALTLHVSIVSTLNMRAVIGRCTYFPSDGKWSNLPHVSCVGAVSAIFTMGIESWLFIRHSTPEVERHFAFVLQSLTLRQCHNTLTIYVTLYMLNLSEGTWNIYLHFTSFHHIDMTQLIKILPQIRQEPTYST